MSITKFHFYESGLSLLNSLFNKTKPAFTRLKIRRTLIL